VRNQSLFSPPLLSIYSFSPQRTEDIKCNDNKDSYDTIILFVWEGRANLKVPTPLHVLSFPNEFIVMIIF
jgi:hypothetical protein